MHYISWQSLVNAQAFRYGLTLRVFFLCFILALFSGCSSIVSKTDRLWMQMNDAEKKQAIINHYLHQLQSESSSSSSVQNQQGSDLNVLRQELAKLRAEVTLLQTRRLYEAPEVVWIPPAF